jgi:hypothetical protein
MQSKAWMCDLFKTIIPVQAEGFCADSMLNFITRKES